MVTKIISSETHFGSSEKAQNWLKGSQTTGPLPRYFPGAHFISFLGPTNNKLISQRRHGGLSFCFCAIYFGKWLYSLVLESKKGPFKRSTGAPNISLKIVGKGVWSVTLPAVKVKSNQNLQNKEMQSHLMTLFDVNAPLMFHHQFSDIRWRLRLCIQQVMLTLITRNYSDGYLLTKNLLVAIFVVAFVGNFQVESFGWSPQKKQVRIFRQSYRHW